jgi:formylglycine-generating enzyme required for sulfatase activity
LLKTFVSVFSFFLFGVVASVTAQEFKPIEQVLPGSSVKFTMVPIPEGSFMVGSPLSDKNKESDEVPQKKVTVSAFWMAEHEVTVEEWDVFFKSADIPQTKAVPVDGISRPTPQYIDLTWGMGRDRYHPVNSMSQAAAIMYCRWLYEKTGVFFRLPTEVEWEYACRAGSATSLPVNVSDKTLQSHGYFNANSAGKYQKVKQLSPNAWGLYDMLGNVSEWTLDQYDARAYENLPVNAKDPVVAPAAKYPRVARGGSYTDDGAELRCTNRIPSRPEWNQRDPQIPKSRWWLTDGAYMGFRIVRPLKQPSKEDIERFYASYLK